MSRRTYLDWRGNGTGTSTPWGKAQTGYSLARGVMFYQTSSHGGLRVTHRWAMGNLSQKAMALGDNRGGYLWYEEDCQLALVLVEHPELWDGMIDGDHNRDNTKHFAQRTVDLYYGAELQAT